MTGATASTPATSRNHQVVQAAMTSVHSRYPATDKPPTPAVALIMVVATTTTANFGNAGRRIESVAAAGPDAHQVATDDRRQRAARRDGQGYCDGIGGARIGEVRGYASRICRCKNRRPHANTAQEDGGEAETSRHPDRNRGRMERGNRQAELRQTKIGHGDDYQVERIDRQITRTQRRKRLCPR